MHERYNIIRLSLKMQYKLLYHFIIRLKQDIKFDFNKKGNGYPTNLVFLIYPATRYRIFYEYIRNEIIYYINNVSATFMGRHFIGKT